MITTFLEFVCVIGREYNEAHVSRGGGGGSSSNHNQL